MNLWGLLNPSLTAKVERSQVKDFLDELTAMSIDLPLSFYQAKLKAGLDKERKTDGSWKMPQRESKMLETKIAYLEQCKEV